MIKSQLNYVGKKGPIWENLPSLISRYSDTHGSWGKRQRDRTTDRRDHYSLLLKWPNKGSPPYMVQEKKLGSICTQSHGSLAGYVKLRVAHVPGVPGKFSPSPLISDLDMHRGTCVTHVQRCIPGSLISGFLLTQWRGKRARHSRRMRNPQFYVSGKRPMP